MKVRCPNPGPGHLTIAAYHSMPPLMAQHCPLGGGGGVVIPICGPGLPVITITTVCIQFDTKDFGSECVCLLESSEAVGRMMQDGEETAESSTYCGAAATVQVAGDVGVH